MEIFIFLVALVGGVLISWFVLKSGYKSAEAYNALDKENYGIKNQLERSKTVHDQLISEHSTLLQKEKQLSEKYILAKREIELLHEKLLKQEKDLEKFHLRFHDQFELLAQSILQKNTESITRLNHEKINTILEPLKEKISSFEKKVEETHLQQTSESHLLKHEIKRLAELNFKISEDANNLTQALKGDNKIQGNWGEIVLERLLENSGLLKGTEFILQGKQLNLKNEDGYSQKPDVVVLLPDNKHIVIDSKVSLKAYDSYVSCQSNEEKLNLLKLHVHSLKNHIKNLSDKYYHSLSTLNTPDFVLLFLPIESCFSISFQSSTFDLFSYAWERKVVIVSPTTLLATLRTVASIWKYENQNKNALHIAEESGKLYDKLYAFVEDLEKIGKGIKTSQAAYDDAMKKISYGKGNLLSKAEKIKSMGINTKRSLETLIEKNGISAANLGGEKDK